MLNPKSLLQIPAISSHRNAFQEKLIKNQNQNGTILIKSQHPELDDNLL
jgi:hypothetical protein